MSISLIAVVGPVEPQLLAAFVDHYRALGVPRFLLAFHFPDQTPTEERALLLDACRGLGIDPVFVSVGPWHETTNTKLRDKLRELAGDGWHLLADADEFHAFPDGLDQTLAAAGGGTVGGLLLDRVATDGRLRAWTPEAGLDAAYPLGGFLTHQLLHGDARKIVAARAGVPVDSGNHRAPGHRPANRPPVVVHHFKWRPPVLADLQRRATMFTTGQWQELSPAVRNEAQRLLDHVADHGGRIAVNLHTMPMRPVSLRRVPPWWAAEAAHLVDTWRPIRLASGGAQNEPAGTSCSPSPAGTSNRA